ncbi:MAG: hypothetical protein OEZ55_04970 [Nitrospinota bacterium]|nr:hypothetical protein [Nitrospinota bacterium]
MRTAAIITLLLALGSMAEDVPSWCKDHPLFPPPAGFLCADYEESEFDAEELSIGENGADIIVEGRVTTIKYSREEEGPADPGKIMDGYAKLIASRDGVKLWRKEENGESFGIFRIKTDRHSIWLKVSAKSDIIDLVVIEGKEAN